MTIYTMIIAGYFIMVILISLFTHKLASKSSADYLVAGRNLGTVICAVVVAAEWLGGMSTIGVSEKSFITGTFQPVLYNFSTALGMVIIGFTVASYYRRYNVQTVSEMLKLLFGEKARIISAISFLIAYLTLAYVQLQTCASVLAPLFNISWTTAVIVSSIIITFYTYIGGMHAIAITGVIHVIAMFAGVGIAAFTGLDKIGGFGKLQELLLLTGAPRNFYNPFSAGYLMAISLLLGGILGGMAGQASIQPIFSAKNESVAVKAAILSGLIVAPFGILTAILGLLARTGYFMDPQSITNPKLVLATLLTHSEFISPVAGGIALAGILAAILSTVGPVNFAVVTILTRDVYLGIINPDADEKKIIGTARKLVILVSVITIPLAIFFKSGILDAAYISYAIRAIGAIVIILGIYARGWITALSVKMAFIGGTISIFVCLMAKKMGWFDVDKTLGAIVAAFLFIFAGILIEKIKGAGAWQERISFKD